jgi:hypothetical protein
MLLKTVIHLSITFVMIEREESYSGIYSEYIEVTARNEIYSITVCDCSKNCALTERSLVGYRSNMVSVCLSE